MTTHCEKVLALLSDGKPHSHREIYGLYVIGHSRIADLRKRGHVIESWRDGDDYLYQLHESAESETDTPSRASAPSPKPHPLEAVKAALPDSAEQLSLVEVWRHALDPYSRKVPARFECHIDESAGLAS